MSADLLAAFGDLHQNGSSKDGALPSFSDTSTVIPRPHPLQTIRQDAKHNKSGQSLWQKDEQGTDVLFDASEPSLADDDEFGDFEGPDHVGVAPERHGQTGSNESDLLGLGDLCLKSEQPTMAPASYTDTSHMLHDPFSGLHDTTSNSQPTLQDVGDNEAEDDWGDFEIVKSVPIINEIAEGKSQLMAVSTQPSTDAFDDEPWEAFTDGTDADQGFSSTIANTETQSSSDITNMTKLRLTSSKDGERVKDRPTNVPPPFSLLQLLIFAVQHLSSRTKLDLVESETILLAGQVVSLYRTTSRIIAGRQQRWKRDTILAQSMRISQVNHRTTGMKLTSLDRSESIKEDQEAVEVVSTWTKYNHTLNPVLLKSKIQKPAMSLGTDLKTRTMTGPGIISEREPCAICGLRRNERIAGIDIKFEDIFEEFWIEHWGHSDCHVFWYTYKDYLRQR